ncbi:MAG: class I SAM-dependent methyltransferase [Deltaproteobacteria bacterium]|nr:class I SAM-dependent methyltransferase [Deltaproteobacteria bacterium]
MGLEQSLPHHPSAITAAPAQGGAPDTAILGSATSSSQMMSAWTDAHLTTAQLAWKHAEHMLIKKAIESGDIVIDLGCGDCRILKSLQNAPFAQYIGVDHDAASIEEARRAFPSPTIPNSTFLAADLFRALPDMFLQEGAPIGRRVAICIGNTLGSFGDLRADALNAMLRFSDVTIVSVCHNTKEITLKRLEYYAKNEIDCRVDWKSGSIFSDAWGESRSFTEESLRALAEQAHAKELGFAAEFQTIAEFGLVMVLTKQQ